MKPGFVAAGMALAVCAGSSFAESTALRSEPIVVTATRTAQTADETLASVTVITREEIERRQAQSVEDLLRGEAGISVANSGGPGKVTSIFLRGTESDHVLVLIDGIKVGSATLGTAAFEQIPIEQIERIEIVRGPRSSLYGSEAIGGVIQIFTRAGGGATAPALKLGGGSHSTYDTSAGITGGGDRTPFSVFATAFSTQGINACRGEAGVAGCFVNEPDKDGFRDRSGALRLGYRIAEDSDIDLHWLRAQGTNEFDGFENRTKFIQEVYGARYRFAPLAWWHATLVAGRSRDDSDNFSDTVFSSRFNTLRNVASWQNDFSVGADQLVTVGTDYQDDRIESSDPFPVTARDNRALFSLYQGRFGRHSLDASVREDDNAQFGRHGTGAVAWGYRIGSNARVYASYGTAFKAPTFNELFFPGFGNPDLRPERSRSAEIGIGASRTRLRWSLNAFQTAVDDLISFDASSLAPKNVDTARIRGLESTIDARAASWDIDAVLTLLDPRNRTPGANEGNLLPRRARAALRLGASRAVGAYRYGALLRAESARYDDLANTQRLGGYATVDLTGEYSVARNWLAQARVANLFDKHYETAQFFNQPSREFFFTLRYQPSTR
jgi:vitamin B12 transporter